MIVSDSRLHAWIGSALGLSALTAYVLTLSGGAFPGESASLIVESSGLFPRLAPPHPLWGPLARTIARIPGGDPAFRLNLLSALCGAAAVLLLYRVVAGAVFACIDVTDKNRARARIASVLAGLGAALALAFCIPFWVVSTRAHTASFDVLHLLACAWLLLLYVRDGRWRNALLFAALYGAGITGFATFIIMAPLFGLAILLAMWKKQALRPGTLLALAGCALLGLLLYAAAAWSFHDSAGYRLREFRSYWHVIWIMWRDQYLLITRSLPRRGWLLVLMLTIVPWLAVLAVSRRALNGERDWTFYLLHVVVTALTLATLFNVKVAPWPMLGLSQFLVTPYVLTASVFGYLAAYWFLLPSTWWPQTAVSEDRSARTGRVGALLSLPLLACVLLPPFINFRTANGRPARLVNDFARQVVECLDGRTWLVTEGIVDANIQLAAGELKAPLRVVSLAWDGNPVLMKYAASLFDAPVLKTRAGLGMMPLLSEWFQSDPEIDRKAAVFAWPDLWIGAGLTPLPNKLVFLGHRGSSGAPHVDALMALHEDFWARAAGLLHTEAGPFLGPCRQLMTRQASLVANNLGCYMEDQGAVDHAAASYRRARSLDPGNISALLNLRTMVAKGRMEDTAGKIREQVDELIAGLGERKLQIWSLARYYGYVRSPEAFAGMGWYWAASGRPGLAVSGLKKAMELMPDDTRGPVRQALADMYLLQDQNAESEALYYELLVENPANQRALLGMARIEMLRGHSEQAEGHLKKAETAGVPALLMDLEWATFHVAFGQRDEARKRAEKVIEEKPEVLRAWAILTTVLILQNDKAGLSRCVEKMKGLPPGRNIVLPTARGHLALMEEDIDGAVRAFEEASAMAPRNVQLLEWLLKLELLQGLQSSVAEHVASILRLDPDHAFANRILGTLQYAEGKIKQAEDSLRRSVEKVKDPRALNDLAWLLQESGLYEEAEQHARASLALDDGDHNAWDTLGVILERTDRLDAAAQAFERAILISPKHVPALLHLIGVRIRQGQSEEGARLVEGLAPRIGEMTSDDRKQLEAFRRKLQP